MTLIRLWPVICFAVFLFGCSTFEDDGRISQGVIEYEVSYPKLDPSSILTELLPTKMTMTFKDNSYMTDLSAGFGMFRMNVIAEGNDKEMHQLVKLINERYVVGYNADEAKASNDQMPEITLKETGKTKEIAGFICKEAIATVHTDPEETFTIYWTDEIHIDNPNWFTQFQPISGVLMEYQIERYNLCSRFKAVKVTSQEVEEELFQVPEEYKKVTENEMDTKMEEIFNSFGE